MSRVTLWDDDDNTIIYVMSYGIASVGLCLSFFFKRMTNQDRDSHTHNLQTQIRVLNGLNESWLAWNKKKKMRNAS